MKRLTTTNIFVTTVSSVNGEQRNHSLDIMTGISLSYDWVKRYCHKSYTTVSQQLFLAANLIKRFGIHSWKPITYTASPHLFHVHFE